jgi:hypothetical protein
MGMADPTNLETIHATLVRDAQRQQRCSSLRRLLDDFVLQPPDTPTDYRGLLQRVQTLVTEELAALDAEATPPAEAPPAPAQDSAPVQAEEGTK